MNGGEGPNSYFRNSTVQEELNGQAKILLMSSIEESLEILHKDDNSTTVFSIADLGCSTGPNTFKCVANIINAVQSKFIGDMIIKQSNLPEFLVLFNDQVSNDFNTLFKSLPTSHRQYMVAAVPGSFHGRLFPKSSINLMHSSLAIHWLSNVPEEVVIKGSALWNRGRITYAQSSTEIMEAFTSQFIKDLEVFFKARSEELVPGGLLCILMNCRPDGPLTKGKEPDHILKLFDLLGDAISDLADQGIVNEQTLDCFNVPIFTPSAYEVSDVISKMKDLRLEKMDKIFMKPKLNTPKEIEISLMMIRAAIESSVREHFGSTKLELIFSKYGNKLEEFAKMPNFNKTEKVEFLFMSLKRTRASS